MADARPMRDVDPDASLGTVRRRRVDPHRAPWAAALDAASVVVFVAIGRRSHDEDPGFGGLIGTVAPFLIAMAISWVAISAWNRPTTLGTGAGVWLGTVAIGVTLRRLAFDDGIATSFVIVATLVLGVFVVGWRAIVHAVDRRRT